MTEPKVFYVAVLSDRLDGSIEVANIGCVIVAEQTRERAVADAKRWAIAHKHKTVVYRCTPIREDEDEFRDAAREAISAGQR